MLRIKIIKEIIDELFKAYLVNGKLIITIFNVKLDESQLEQYKNLDDLDDFNESNYEETEKLQVFLKQKMRIKQCFEDSSIMNIFHIEQICSHFSLENPQNITSIVFNFWDFEDRQIDNMQNLNYILDNLQSINNIVFLNFELFFYQTEQQQIHLKKNRPQQQYDFQDNFDEQYDSFDQDYNNNIINFDKEDVLKQSITLQLMNNYNILTSEDDEMIYFKSYKLHLYDISLDFKLNSKHKNFKSKINLNQSEIKQKIDKILLYQQIPEQLAQVMLEDPNNIQFKFDFQNIISVLFSYKNLEFVFMSDWTFGGEETFKIIKKLLNIREFKQIEIRSNFCTTEEMYKLNEIESLFLKTFFLSENLLRNLYLENDLEITFQNKNLNLKFCIDGPFSIFLEEGILILINTISNCKLLHKLTIEIKDTGQNHQNTQLYSFINSLLLYKSLVNSFEIKIGLNFQIIFLPIKNLQLGHDQQFQLAEYQFFTYENSTKVILFIKNDINLLAEIIQVLIFLRNQIPTLVKLSINQYEHKATHNNQNVLTLQEKTNPLIATYPISLSNIQIINFSLYKMKYLTTFQCPFIQNFRKSQPKLNNCFIQQQQRLKLIYQLQFSYPYFKKAKLRKDILLETFTFIQV